MDEQFIVAECFLPFPQIYRLKDYDGELIQGSLLVLDKAVSGWNDITL